MPLLTTPAAAPLTARRYVPRRRMFSSKIFRSRWAAMFWAGGILWTAYDVAEANVPDPAVGNGAAATDQTGDPVNNADVGALVNALGQAGKQDAE